MIRRNVTRGSWEQVDDQNKNEELTDEELQKLVLEAQREALLDAAKGNTNQKPRRPFPKWIFWFIAFSMVLNAIAFLPEKFSIPAIKFLKTSIHLSKQENIQTYKKAVVVIAADDSRGTGFSISSDGIIVTNYHVIEGHDKVTVAFPDDGPFNANVVHTYPEIDIAILETDEEQLPSLPLADKMTPHPNEHVTFIGNPLRFQGIVNEGTIIEKTKLRTWDEDVVMMDAPVYRGNSGSPVLNDEGQVIGIVFATLHHDEHGKVGLFVPIDVFHRYHSKNPS